MPGLGAPELLLVAGVIVLLFGAKKLPEFARSLGKAKGEFKRGLSEEDKEQSKPDEEESSPEAK
jgi:sec-independent protein translocase protein TatA